MKIDMNSRRWKKLSKKAKKEHAVEWIKAPKCLICNFRCDKPYGNGTLCFQCASKHTDDELKSMVF